MDEHGTQHIVMDPRAIEVLKRPIPKELIKQREGGGGKQLDYVEGATVISLLNEAFNYVWSSEIMQIWTAESVPTKVTTWNGATKKKEPVLNPDGTQKYQSEPPVVHVRVRLTDVNTGVFHEGTGSKILIGGASEQEGAVKSAVTDAIKVAAKQFGIALELYTDKGGDNQAQQKQSYSSSYSNKSNSYQREAPKEPPKESAKTEENPWDKKKADTKRLGDLKELLGIQDNEKLNPFVAEFTGTSSATWKMITPENITAFNKFLENKV